ncbi:MAG: YtxH domain-containing protein [Balneolaceae bacterium]
MSNTGKGLVIGLLTGAVIGSAISILYAPDKGRNTRDRLSYQLSKYIDDLNDIIAELKKEKRNLASDAKQKGDKVIQDAKHRADDLIKEAENLLSNIEKNK